MPEPQTSKCQHAHGTLGELIARIRENLGGEREGGPDQMHRDLDEAQRCMDECAAGCECRYEDRGSWAFLAAGTRERQLKRALGSAVFSLRSYGLGVPEEWPIEKLLQENPSNAMERAEAADGVIDVVRHLQSRGYESGFEQMNEALSHHDKVVRRNEHTKGDN